jgi:DNA-binding CsgD family transcriptional regulator
LERVFRNEAAEAKMALALQVLSSHLLGALGIEEALSVQRVLVKFLLPHAASEAEAVKRPNCPRLFLLDGCSLKLPLGPLSGRLRANSPGSKFLALLPPERSGESEMMLLFHWGIDGFVTLHQKWKTELPEAALVVFQGGLWVPSGVLLAFVKQMKTMLDRQLLAGQSLTAREGQVLQLLFRHFTNKEIAHQLNICERTAKFHVSNVLRKLGIENRMNLLVSPLVD